MAHLASQGIVRNHAEIPPKGQPEKDFVWVYPGSSCAHERTSAHERTRAHTSAHERSRVHERATSAHAHRHSDSPAGGLQKESAQGPHVHVQMKLWRWVYDDSEQVDCD